MSVVGGSSDPLPVARRGSRRSVNYEPWHNDKEQLVDLFRNLQSGAVDSNQIELARILIDKLRGKKWYEFVPLDCILKDNGVSLLDFYSKKKFIKNKSCKNLWLWLQILDVQCLFSIGCLFE